MLLPEIKQIGLYNSQIVTKNIAVTPKRTVARFEIELPVESGGIAYIDDAEYKIEPNMIICAKPGQVRYTKLPYKCYYFHLDAADSDLRELLTHLPDVTTVLSYAHYEKLFHQILKINMYDDENKEMLIYGVILKLLCHVSDDARKMNLSRSENTPSYPVIQKIISYIEENLTEDLSLAALAKRSGYSTVHFHNSFKKHTGKTLRVYIEDLRLNRAIEMMLTSNRTLTEISYLCGFSSQSYFSYAFKRNLGQSPGEYMKSINKHYPFT